LKKIHTLVLFVTLLFIPVADAVAAGDSETSSVEELASSIISEFPGTELLISIRGPSGTLEWASSPEIERSLVEIGSASKWFTAISVLRLVEQGELNLDQAVSSLLTEPELSALATIGDRNYWDQITLGMLLNHSSGIQDYLNAFASDDEALAAFADPEKKYRFTDVMALAIAQGDAAFVPGTGRQYCNTCYIMLGEIIRRVIDAPWQQAIRADTLNPAGMESTVFGEALTKGQNQQRLKGHFKGKQSQMPFSLAGSAGEILSTREDLHRFLAFWRNDPSMVAIREMQTRPIPSEVPAGEKGWGYGLYRSSGLLGHAGQTFGFQTYIGIDPDSGNRYVIVANEASLPVELLLPALKPLADGLGTD
jgi:D-alanyl-D-alanine carboxypeptidase